AWVYNSSRTELTRNVQRLITNYNAQLPAFEQYRRAQGIVKANEKDVTAYLAQAPEAADQRHVKWSRSLRTYLARGTRIEYDADHLIGGIYRPFQPQHAYYDRYLNHERSQLPSMFPTPHHDNIGIVLTGPASHFEFTPFIAD